MDERKDTKAVEVGDLVSWQAGAKTRVGVVLSVNEDGTCTIDVTERDVRRSERIRTQRLEVITSTIKPQASPVGAEPEAERPGSPPTEPPFS